MITTKMTDDDILEYLMTSDFNEGLNSEEARFVLLKFRQFYRFQVSKNTQLLHSIDKLERDSAEDFALLKEAHDLAITELTMEQLKNKRELERDLTFMERLTGKIKRNKDNEIR